jgi:hypothetical protein
MEVWKGKGMGCCRRGGGSRILVNPGSTKRNRCFAIIRGYGGQPSPCLVQFFRLQFVRLYQKLQLLHTVLPVNITCDMFLKKNITCDIFSHVSLTGGSNHKIFSFLKQMVRIVAVL